MLKRTLLALATTVAFCVTASAEIHLPKVLSDHAVLQRQRPVHLWGWASADAQLTAHFHRQTVRTQADALGRWSVYLAPEEAGGPYTLSIEGDGAPATVDDLLVGDVWVASGQSNMEMPLDGFPPGATVHDAAKEIAGATQPRIRLLLVEHKSSDFPLNDLAQTQQWTTCTPETARKFSAVAYLFGREISAKENVPIGLIDSAVGGTPADSWLSLDTLGTDANLLPAFASRARFSADVADFDRMSAAEKREDDAAKAAGKPTPGHPWHPWQASWEPSALYNAMIAPLAPMSIKGFLWYQGETNSGSDRAPFYNALMTGLIRDWRMHFAQGNLPFLYVQLSSFYSPGENWGLLRDQQRRTLATANTAMAVTLDVGLAGNVHPPDKQTVAARLALAARVLVYGETVAFQGPLFRQVTTELQSTGNPALRVWFDHAQGLTFHGQPVTGFEIAGDDRKFNAADARIDGETVVASSVATPHPRYVRFAWSGVVANSLYNAAGLPAPTFTSEP